MIREYSLDKKRRAAADSRLHVVWLKAGQAQSNQQEDVMPSHFAFLPAGETPKREAEDVSAPYIPKRRCSVSRIFETALSSLAAGAIPVLMASAADRSCSSSIAQPSLVYDKNFNFNKNAATSHGLNSNEESPGITFYIRLAHRQIYSYT